MKKAKVSKQKAEGDREATGVAGVPQVAKGSQTPETAEITEPRTARAVGKYLKISPTKVRGVLNLVRGESVKEARRILRFSPKRGAQSALKVLDSAVANANTAGPVDEEGWIVLDVRADKGPSFRRKRDPKARGSWGTIKTSMTHLTIGIKESEARSKKQEAGSRTLRERGRNQEAGSKKRARVSRGDRRSNKGK